MEFDGFDWDGGNRDKCLTHGVSIREIEALFASELRVGPDPCPAMDEQRFRAVGKTGEGRNIFVVFTLRAKANGILIRPISARYMHRKEVEAYEKEVSRVQER